MNVTLVRELDQRGCSGHWTSLQKLYSIPLFHPSLVNKMKTVINNVHSIGMNTSKDIIKVITPTKTSPHFDTYYKGSRLAVT